MAGFGSMPMGSGPFGLGTPAAATVPPDGPAGSRYLNPLTRDYEVDSSTGQFKQMPGPRQRVLLTVLTALDSSAVPGFGVKLPGRMGDSFEAECQQAVRAALRQMVEIEKIIRLDDIKVERGMAGRARITISFTDLVTGTQDRVRV